MRVSRIFWILLSLWNSYTAAHEYISGHLLWTAVGAFAACWAWSVAWEKEEDDGA